MGLFEMLDMELQNNLISFIKAQEEREDKTFGEYMVPEMLKLMISGECRMTGAAKNDKTGKMYCEFSFWEENDGP